MLGVDFFVFRYVPSPAHQDIVHIEMLSATSFLSRTVKRLFAGLVKMPRLLPHSAPARVLRYKRNPYVSAYNTSFVPIYEAEVVPNSQDIGFPPHLYDNRCERKM